MEMDVKICPENIKTFKVRVYRFKKKYKLGGISIPSEWLARHDIKDGTLITLAYLGKVEEKIKA